MSYHQFKNHESADFGSFEVFYVSEKEASENPDLEQAGYGDCPTKGWYWWACFPGCLPDGDPSGPFATEQEAIDDAQNI